MAVKPVPLTATVGGKITAAAWNTSVKGTWDFLDGDSPIFYGYQGTSQSIPVQTFTSINLDTEVVDRDGQHSTVTNVTRVTIGNTLGWYRLSGVIAWPGNASGSRRGYFYYNGTTIIEGSYVSASNAGADFVSTVFPPVYVQSTAAGDYVEMRGWHNSTVALSLAVSLGSKSAFTVEYVGS